MTINLYVLRGKRAGWNSRYLIVEIKGSLAFQQRAS